MNGPTLAALLVAAPFALVNWVGVARQDRRLVWVAKPAVLALFVVAAITLDPVDATLRAWFVAGLALSLAGDVFLMVPEEREAKVPPFLLGLVAFLLGHIAYLVGLITVFDSWPLAVAGLVVVAVAGAVLAPRIVAGVRRAATEMVPPVLIYMAVISAMVVAAFGRGVLVGIAGALLFWASDAILAWNRFVHRALILQVAVMVTYHLGQLGLLLSLLV